MRRYRRRDMIIGATAATLGAAWSRSGRAAREAPVPFAPGDVLVGCTQLNNAQDDHAGRGRILHYDGSLKPKGTIWLDDTTHIVNGLRFAPDRTLWAFDVFAFKILRIAPTGERLPDFTTVKRPFGNVAFASDGSLYLGEAHIGSKSRVPLRTTIPFLPGTERFGDGHLFLVAGDGKVKREFATQVHGGMGGFQAVSSIALAPDGKSIVYASESGPRLMRYDVVADRQMPDVLRFPDNSGKFFFDVAFDQAGRLLAIRGLTIDALDLDGRVLQSYPLGSFGWASLSRPVTPDHVYATNWFTGDIVKLDLKSGAVLARTNVGARKALAGVAEFA